VIASVRGTVATVGLDRVVVEVGGVGILLHTTPATAAGCRRGHELTLATTLVVREDSLTLFGFGSADERDVFETVQTVSGVGPRLALAMLSVMAPEDLRVALSTADVASLTKIPGIGRKSAERLVLELRDKVGAVGGGHAGSAAVGAVGGPRRDQVTEALVGLGWSARQAVDAVGAVAPQAGEDADVATLLRLALRELAR
jgi:Holliday junction DNA helicase RuvA